MMSNNLKFVNLTFFMFFFKKLTHCGLKYPLPFYVSTSLKEIWLFLPKNNKGIFVKIRLKISEGLDFQNSVFRRFLNQIILNYNFHG